MTQSSENTQGAVATVSAKKVEVQLGSSGLPQLTTLDEMYRVAKALATSGITPPHYKDDPGAVMMVMMLASELGINVTQAINSFHYIVPYGEKTGRITMPSEMMRMLIERSGKCKQYRYGWEGESEELVAWVESWREGNPEPYPIARFGVPHAKKAGLIRKDQQGRVKQSNWTKYPEDMALWRAISRDARRNWSDVIANTPSIEEMRDAGEQTVAPPPTIEVQATESAPDPLLVEAEVVAPAEEPANAPHETDSRPTTDATEVEDTAEPDEEETPVDDIGGSDDTETVWCEHPDCELQAHSGSHLNADGQAFTD